MLTEKFYRNSYSFLSSDLNLNELPLERILESDFLLENYSFLNWEKNNFFIDILPRKMKNEIFFLEFEYESNSNNSVWNKNFIRYYDKFERVILMLIAYADEVYVNSSYLDQEIIKLSSKEEYNLIKETITKSLEGEENTIISFPKNKTIICFNSLFVNVISVDDEFRQLIQKVVLTEGLYIRD